MSDAVRVALVGCGGMGRNHAHAYQVIWESQRRPSHLVAVCDIDETAAEKLADQVAEWQEHRPQVLTDIAQVADHPGIDAADICTVHRTHHELAVPCLQAGKHVTIEKPLAITLRAARLILDAASQSGAMLQVAENYRRAAEHRAVRWAIDQGRIGTPWMLTWTDVFERLTHWGWRDDKLLAGGGWSFDGGVHFCDLFRYHLGDIDSVYGVSESFHPIRYRDREQRVDPVEVDVEDSTMAVLSFASGARGSWVHSNAGFGHELHQRSIHGSEGSVQFGEGVTAGGVTVSMIELIEEFKTQISLEENERLFPAGITNPVACELYEFLRAVRGEGDIETTGMEGFKSQAVAMALYESAAAGQTVTLEQVETLNVEAYQQPINEQLGLG